MPRADDSTADRDPFDLRRFVSAQDTIYDDVLAELRAGKKRTHWMWFIFPQFDGLGFSSTSKHYAIKSKQEAQHYVEHPVLGKRLIECATTVLNIKGRSASTIFGAPDDAKLRSSMTLFAAVSAPDSVFAQVLDTYFDGNHDATTLNLLAQHRT